MPEPYTRAGRVSRYGLACGYVERRTTGDRYGNDSILTELYVEHGCYHVRQYDRRPNGIGVRACWYSTWSFALARRAFDKCAGAIVLW